MAEPTEWSFPRDLQPQADAVEFDLDAALRSVVLIRAEIPEDAFTAEALVGAGATCAFTSLGVPGALQAVLRL